MNTDNSVVAGIPLVRDNCDPSKATQNPSRIDEVKPKRDRKRVGDDSLPDNGSSKRITPSKCSDEITPAHDETSVNASTVTPGALLL